uniref:2'-5' RNA ligase superfamily protein n=1 Tax=Candidatus Kentrum sp. FW TaxID=2126338 RepID=A0A450SAC7_9GAMM|nr:MAG: hypothetical protein BECKFW1821A_GA0114235_102140 [Candidatus Kentron sp. FW]
MRSLQERIKRYKSNHPYITIGGIGSFLNNGVYVIYIKADCGDLEKYDLWEKPDYKDSYNPHITIYEGRNEKVARRVHNELASLNMEHKCRDYDFSVHTLNQFDLNN